MSYKIPDPIQVMLDELHELQAEMEAHEAELSQLQARQYAIKGEIAALEIPPLKAEMEASTSSRKAESRSVCSTKRKRSGTPERQNGKKPSR